jgi:Na+/H+ antiporter NhaD/arsenite permease-like protein
VSPESPGSGHSLDVAYQQSYSLRRDYLLWGLVAVCVGFSALNPASIPSYPRSVNWPTIGTLLGLMILTKGLEHSGWLQRVGREIVARIDRERNLALFLISGSALLSMLLTNDVTLFIVVPLTLELGGLVRLPVRRLVVFEALAVNAGSMLSPIGNPQNIFLWQLSGLHFGRFTLHMLPPFLITGACLFLMSFMAFPNRHVHAQEMGSLPRLRLPLLLISLLLYIPFLLLADLHYVAVGLALVGAVFLAGYRQLLRNIDWPLLLVFVFMFIDLDILSRFLVVGFLGLAHTGALYLAGVLSSQVISNVPAAILLSKYSSDWITIAWAVDAGGFGLIIGSLANIIALRIARQPGSLAAFHAWSVPFFIVVSTVIGIWLMVR